MRTGLTITLARDVADPSDVLTVEAELLAKLAVVLDELQVPGELEVLEGAQPYKTGFTGGGITGQEYDYRLMRDAEKQPQYTEVRVRAYLGESTSPPPVIGEES